MNYLETLKNIAKNKEKRTENLIFLVIMLVILLIAINYIFFPKVEDKENTSNNDTTSDNIMVSEEVAKTDLEQKLESVLSQISGITEVSVVLTYFTDKVTTPIYNTKETTKDGETTNEKSVAYNEDGSKKTAIIESVELPKVEGAIVVAKGADTVEKRSKISSAIAAVTNIAAYKVQVFEK